jgi:hypothetical protein
MSLYARIWRWGKSYLPLPADNGDGDLGDDESSAMLADAAVGWMDRFVFPAGRNTFFVHNDLLGRLDSAGPRHPLARPPLDDEGTSEATRGDVLATSDRWSLILAKGDSAADTWLNVKLRECFVVADSSDESRTAGDRYLSEAARECLGLVDVPPNHATILLRGKPGNSSDADAAWVAITNAGVALLYLVELEGR